MGMLVPPLEQSMGPGDPGARHIPTAAGGRAGQRHRMGSEGDAGDKPGPPQGNEKTEGSPGAPPRRPLAED